MKTFRHACAAFILAITLSAFFSVYTCVVIEKMQGFADSLPDGADGDKFPVGIIEAEQFWDKRKLFLSLSVSHSELDEIEEAMSAVATSLESKEAAAYSTAVSNLKERLARLLESERLSLEGIL